MSSLTQCNYCALQNLKRLAQSSGRTLELVARNGGWDVLIYYPGETPDSEKHWAAWFMAISASCVC